jgi:hypothetical protein
MKKILLIAIFLIQITILPSWAADNVVIDRATQNEAEQLDIEIPEETPAGFHQVVIEVSDDAGIVSEKTLYFCKNLQGEVKWDNDCPDLKQPETPSAEPAPEEVVAEPASISLPSYKPTDDPKSTQSLQIAAFALLSALGAGAASSTNRNLQSQSPNQSARRDNSDNSDNSDNEGEYEKSNDSDDLGSVSAGGLGRITRSMGRGDRSKTWRHPRTEAVDKFHSTSALDISSFSPLLARTILDNSYLRAIIGSFATLLTPIAILLGVLAVLNVDGEALPPTLWIVIAIACLAALDATSGLIAASIFALGVLLNDNIFSRDQFLSVCGIFIIFFAPALIASAIRPFRRLVKNGDDRWERISDYFLTGLLSFWAIEKIVGALNGLSGFVLPISSQATTVAAFTAGAVIVRVALEDLATYEYPVRLNIVTVDLKEPSKYQQFVSLELKAFIFVMLAMPFVGFNIQLLLGTILFLVPSIANLTFVNRLPKLPGIYRVIPKGVFRIVVMIFVGSAFAQWVESRFSNPADYIAWSFVILTIPGLILKFAGDFASKPRKDWKDTEAGRWIYRVVGVVVFLIMIQVVRGVDITTWI